MNPDYYLVAITRLPNGEIEIVGGQSSTGKSVRYRLNKDSAWDDLCALLEDPDLPKPEPIQAAAAGVEAPGVAVEMIEGVATTLYGPFVGKLVRSVSVGGKTLIGKMQQQ